MVESEAGQRICRTLTNKETLQSVFILSEGKEDREVFYRVNSADKEKPPN